MKQGFFLLVFFCGVAVAQPPNPIPTGLSGANYQSAVNAWLSYLYTGKAPVTSGTAILKGNGSGGFSAASAGTDYLAPNGSAASLTSFPTLNQNTSGTAANLSGTPALPNGTTATTQTANDNSTKLATTAYADAIRTARNLNGPGIAAKCQSGVAAAGFSLPSSNAPSATCESDGFQAYLAWTANTAQTAYDRFILPADWTGTLKLVIGAYSTSTSAPTVGIQLSCISTAAVASPTFGTSQSISLTPGATSGRTSVSTTLTTTNTYANKACAAGDMVTWKLAITANAAADLRVLSVRFTE